MSLVFKKYISIYARIYTKESIRKVLVSFDKTQIFSVFKKET